MLPVIIWVSILVAWLLYETDWMQVRLPVGMEGYMKLPSGVWITKEDYVYLESIIKPVKSKKVSIDGCWYCSNGHDRHHFDLGLMSYDLCECGATIIPLPKKRKVTKSAYAKLASEVATIQRRNYNPVVASQYKSKRMKGV